MTCRTEMYSAVSLCSLECRRTSMCRLVNTVGWTHDRREAIEANWASYSSLPCFPASSSR